MPRCLLVIGYRLSAVGCRQSVISPFQGCLNLWVITLLAGSDVPIVMCAATFGSCESLLLETVDYRFPSAKRKHQ
ncbi:MAG: hypothetical protein OXH39_04150 [Candidatus Poribacteria bacterium]|nr:hypothetical protein [Candidatus Poribacteria bacterium]